MASPYGRGGGRGRGRGYINQPLWESRPGKPPMQTIKPDPVSGCYKLHVKSIPANWNETMLRNLFLKVGEPTSVYLNTIGNYPLNWGFVEFETFKEASEAVKLVANNYVRLHGIEVSFAREKADDSSFIEEDYSVFDFLNNPTTPAAYHTQSPRFEKTVHPPETNTVAPVSIPKIIKTIQNDLPLRSSILLENCRILPDKPEEIAYIENAIFNRLMSVYESVEASNKCEVCGKDTNQSCEDCTVHYCSKTCQSKHWPAHSKTCFPLTIKTKSNSQTDLRGSGDYRPQERRLANGTGNGSDELNRRNRSQENNYNGNRFEERQRYDNRHNFNNNNNDRPHNRFGDKQQNRFNNASNERGNYNRERSGFNNDRFGNRQNESGAPRTNMYEERRSRFNIDRQSKSEQSKREADNEEAWDAPEPNEDKAGNNQKSEAVTAEPQSVVDLVSSSVETQSQAVCVKSEILTAEPQSVSNLVAPSVEAQSLAACVKSEILTAEPQSVSNLVSPSIETQSLAACVGDVPESTSTSFDLKPGSEEEAVIMVTESPGVFYVQLRRQIQHEFMQFNEKLNSPNSPYIAYTPVEEGICVSLYVDTWCRCKVTSLDPLRVFYIDYGNYETMTKDRLFTLPDDLASKTPFALKIKLAQGTPAEYFNKKADEEFCIKAVDKVDDYWVVEVPGVDYPPPPTQNPSESVSLTSQVKQGSTQAAVVPSYPKLLPADIFTEVCVKHKDPSYLAVTPVASLTELEKFSARLQVHAVKAAPITPAITKCLALCPVTNHWCRGRILQLDPLYVKFVDIGITRICNAADLRELSTEFASIPPFVVFIKPQDGTVEELSQKSKFSVKPLYKEKDGCWVVEVAPEEAKHENKTDNTSLRSETTSVPELTQSPSTTHQTKTTYPELLIKDQFTTVVIIGYPETENIEGDTYIVAKTNFMTSLTEMSQYLGTAARNILASPQIGDIGVALFENLWYRVRVVSQLPLRVFYMDYGSTDTIKPEELMICPNSHKDVPPLVCKVKLAPGTNRKFCNLPRESKISIKPVSMLSDDTVLVQIEGEDYSESVSPVITEGIHSTGVTSSAQVPAPTQELQTLGTEVSNYILSNGVAENTEPQSIVDLLKEEYEVKFFINKVDVAENMLFGTLFSDHFPETVNFVMNEELNNIMDVEPLDPNFKPHDGELVVHKTEDWNRAKFLEVGAGGWLYLIDSGTIVEYGQCKRLPQQFCSVPFLAVVLKLPLPVNMELLQAFVVLERRTRTKRKNVCQMFKQNESSELDIKFKVVEAGPTRCVVKGEVNNIEVKAQLEKWSFEPITWPLPLSSGTLVCLAKVIHSNLFSVNPVEYRKTVQTIQIECTVNIGKKFQVPPKVGDYVAHKDEEGHFYRGRIERIDVNNICSILYIDIGYKISASIDSLQPLPTSLFKIPRQATQVVLEGVKSVELTELAKLYIGTLVENDTVLRMESDKDLGLVTLTIEENKEVVNTKLNELLTPKVVPDLNGKFTHQSLPDPRPPLNTEVTFLVTQTEPLYLQNKKDAIKYYAEVHTPIAEYAESENGLYNPCENEICIAKLDYDWYRARCLKETNTGVNSLMLVDFGNISNIPTKDIRKIPERFLTFPIIGLPCKVMGLPKQVNFNLQGRLNEILVVDSEHKGTLEYGEDGYFHVRLPGVLNLVEEEGLVPH